MLFEIFDGIVVVDANGRESIEMDADGFGGAAPLRGEASILVTHGEIVANGQNGGVEFGPTWNDLHIEG